jgi:hypothetical protein
MSVEGCDERLVGRRLARVGHRGAELVGCYRSRREEDTTMAEGQSMTVADVVAKTMDGRA